MTKSGTFFRRINLSFQKCIRRTLQTSGRCKPILRESRPPYEIIWRQSNCLCKKFTQASLWAIIITSSSNRLSRGNNPFQTYSSPCWGTRSPSQAQWPQTLWSWKHPYCGNHFHSVCCCVFSPCCSQLTHTRTTPTAEALLSCCSSPHGGGTWRLDPSDVTWHGTTVVRPGSRTLEHWSRSGPCPWW